MTWTKITDVSTSWSNIDDKTDTFSAIADQSSTWTADADATSSWDKEDSIYNHLLVSTDVKLLISGRDHLLIDKVDIWT